MPLKTHYKKGDHKGMTLTFFKTYISIFFFCLLSCCTIAQKEVIFEAKTNAKKVLKGKAFRVEFVLQNSRADQFKMPANLEKHFDILSRSKQMSSVITNGQGSFAEIFQFNLRAKKSGMITIGPAYAKVKGKPHKSNSLTIEVVEPIAGQNSSAEKIFFRIEPDKREAFVNEQIILDYKIYYVQETQMSRIYLNEEPDLDHFLYGGEMTQFIKEPDIEIINGQQYVTRTAYRFAVYPRKAGNIIINPQNLFCNIIKDYNPNRPMGNFFAETEQISLSSDPIDINVKSAPTPEPPTFSGAVGTFTGTASVDNTKLSTDDALTLKVTIKGDGDVKQIRVPDLVLSDSLEVYDQKEISENTDEENARLYGTKTFQYIIIPKEPGRYALNPSFTYLDSDTRSYNQVRLDSFELFVRKGNNNNTPVIIDEATPKPIIKNIRSSASLEGNSIDSFFNTIPFWVLFAMPFLIVLAAFGYKTIRKKRENVDVSELKIRRATKVAKKRLATAEAHIKAGNDRAFYDEISKALLGYVSDKFQLPGSELSKNNVKGKLEKAGVSSDITQRFIQLLQTAEMAVFGGAPQGGTQEVYKEALRLIEEVEDKK